MKSKSKRQPKRYICEKCGRKSAVKHDKGRFRCLKCRSIYGQNSRKSCYNKEEYLVFKTLLELFELKAMKAYKNEKYLLKDFVKKIKEVSTEGYKKLVEINAIRRLDAETKLRLIETNLEDIVILTKDQIGRFQLYTNLLRNNETYNLKSSIVEVKSGGKYHYENKMQELKHEVETQKNKKLHRLSI